MATKVAARRPFFGTPTAHTLGPVRLEGLVSSRFPAGSMGPKVAAAVAFAAETGRPAAIGKLADAMAIIRGERGTRIQQS